MQPILERRDDAEVAAAATHAPEQVGVFLLARLEQPSISGDHIHGDDVVARQAVLADQPAHAAANGQSGDTGGGDHAHCGREAKGLCFAVEFPDRETRFGAHGPRCGINADTLHGRQIDDQAAVTECAAADVVTAAADGDQQAMLACEADRDDDVGEPRAARNQPRMSLDARIPDPPGAVVLAVAVTEHSPPE